MFYETLGMRSTSEVVSLYAKAARSAGSALADQRVVDLGASNGLGGEQLTCVGRGRPDWHRRGTDAARGCPARPTRRYDDSLVADLLTPTAPQLNTLKQFAPTAVVALSAVGIGHLPPRALDRALALLRAAALFGFAATPTLLPDSRDDDGRTSVFPLTFARCGNALSCSPRSTTCTASGPTVATIRSSRSSPDPHRRRPARLIEPSSRISPLT